jgi:hypothetical protein
VSLFPSKGGVTRVISQEEKEQSRLKEFQFIETLNSLRQGHIPHNDELLAGIDAIHAILETARVDHHRELSRDGQEIIHDLESLCDTLHQVISVKNKDSRLQKLAFHSRLAAKSTSGELYGRNPDVQESLQVGTGALGTLIQLLVSNAQFRKLLVDILDVR